MAISMFQNGKLLPGHPITDKNLLAKLETLLPELSETEQYKAYRASMEAMKSGYIGNPFGREGFDKLVCTSRVIDPRDPDFKKYIFTCTNCGNTDYKAKPRVLNQAIKDHPELSLTCNCTDLERRREGYNNSIASVEGLPYYKEIRMLLYDMNDRCYNENNGEYDKYGAKGVSICKEWRLTGDYWTDKLITRVFYDWAMANGYKPGLQINRNKNNGNYCPENCSWVTPKENMNNRGPSQRVEYLGKVYTYNEFAKKYKTLRQYLLDARQKYSKDEAAVFIYEKIHHVTLTYNHITGMYIDNTGLTCVIPKIWFFNLYPDKKKGPIPNHKAYIDRILENAADGTVTDVVESIDLAEIGIDPVKYPHIHQTQSRSRQVQHIRRRKGL